MSWKLKILAALNIVGWAVVVPLLVSSLLNPLLDFRDWPGSDLLGRPAQEASLADLGQGGKQDPGSAQPGSLGARPDSITLPRPPARGLGVGAPGSVPAPVATTGGTGGGIAGGTGGSGVPIVGPERSGVAGTPRPLLPLGPRVGFPSVPVPGLGPVNPSPGPWVVPIFIAAEPELPSAPAPGGAGPITGSAPDVAPMTATTLVDSAPEVTPEPTSAGTATPQPTASPTATPTPSAGRVPGTIAPPVGTAPPGHPEREPDDDPPAKSPPADRPPKHPGPQAEDGGSAPGPYPDPTSGSGGSGGSGAPSPQPAPAAAEPDAAPASPPAPAAAEPDAAPASPPAPPTPPPAPPPAQVAPDQAPAASDAVAPSQP